MKIKHIISQISMVFLFFATGCTKFVDPPLPSNEILSSGAFINDATGTSVLLAAYSSVYNTMKAQILLTDLFSDEIFNPAAGGSMQEAQENTYSANSNYGLFENYYSSIFQLNSILETLDGPTGVTQATARQIRGEARFLRAFCYFQLVNLYGTPPLITSTDVRISSQVPNTAAINTWALINEDLAAAFEMVNEEYPSDDRVRVNKNAVKAFIARASLYQRNWAAADDAATEVIEKNYTLPTDLSSVFKRSSSETIWQFWADGGFTSQGINYIPSNGASSSFYQLRDRVLLAFEPNDARKSAWLNSGSDGKYYPFKYKVADASGTSEPEYDVQLRLAEQYLIRAEARAHLSKLSDALDDLNVVRVRAGLEEAEISAMEDLLLAIEQERRVEFMTENGHRWFDLKRTGRSDFWLGAQKQTWQPRDTILPYYINTLTSSPRLEQNEGY